MQKPENAGVSFESGKVVLSTGDLNVLNVNLTRNVIDVDVEDKGFIKRIIAMRGEISETSQPLEDEEIENEVRKRGPGPLKMLKSFAEALSRRGITLTVSYKGGTVITIGADARSTLLQLITKTKSVAINNFYNLLRMVI